METKVFNILLGIAALVNYGKSENTTSCIGIYDGICVNIPNDATYDRLREQCTETVEHLTNAMKSYGNDLMRNAEVTPDSRCVYYHKVYPHGGKATQEICMPVQQAETYCPNQFMDNATPTYAIKICLMCGPSPFVNTAHKFVQNSLYVAIATLSVNFGIF